VGADVARDGLPVRAQARAFPPLGLEPAPGLREPVPVVLELMLLEPVLELKLVPALELELEPAQVAAIPGAPGHAAPPAVVRAGHPAA
jgi:hypothetical protein